MFLVYAYGSAIIAGLSCPSGTYTDDPSDCTPSGYLSSISSTYAPTPSPSEGSLRDDYSSDYAPPPSSTPNPVCGCEEMDVTFCNYDYGYFGFCESCGDVSSSPCDQRGLPDAGVADCEACCNVSHPYPHPRPNCSGS